MMSRSGPLAQQYAAYINPPYAARQTRGLSGRARLHFIGEVLLMAERNDVLDARAYTAVHGLRYVLETGRTSGMTEAWLFSRRVRDLAAFLGELAEHCPTQADVAPYMAAHVRVDAARDRSGRPVLVRAAQHRTGERIGTDAG